MSKQTASCPDGGRCGYLTHERCGYLTHELGGAPHLRCLQRSQHRVISERRSGGSAAPPSVKGQGDEPKSLNSRLEHVKACEDDAARWKWSERVPMLNRLYLNRVGKVIAARAATTRDEVERQARSEMCAAYEAELGNERNLYTSMGDLDRVKGDLTMLGSMDSMFEYAYVQECMGVDADLIGTDAGVSDAKRRALESAVLEKVNRNRRAAMHTEPHDFVHRVMDDGSLIVEHEISGLRLMVEDPYDSPVLIMSDRSKIESLLERDPETPNEEKFGGSGLGIGPKMYDRALALCDKYQGRELGTTRNRSSDSTSPSGKAMRAKMHARDPYRYEGAKGEGACPWCNDRGTDWASASPVDFDGHP